MTTTKKYITALGAFFVLALGLSACGGGIPGNSVAAMAGNPITTQTFNHWMYVAAKGQASESSSTTVIVPNDPPSFTNCITQVRKQIPSLAKTPDATIKSDCSQLFTSLSSQVMDFLIKAYWYQAEAHKLGISITNAQVQAAFVKAEKQEFPTAAEFQSFLTETGQTQADILYRVRINQIFTKLEARYSKPVTPAAISAYYTAHTSQFGTPETVDLNFIRTKTASAANAAKSALASGQSFKTVAKKYSLDSATKNNAGLLKGVTKGEEELAFSNAIFAAPAGKLEGPVHGQFGYYVFKVSSIKKATQKSLAQATAQIKTLLTEQQSTAAQTKVDALVKAAWGKKTTCRALYSMDDCYGYKAPKTTTSSATAPATATTGAATTGAATTSTTSSASSSSP
jgi:parvulin-like peptidyl-prolyl isomerase